MMKTIWNIVIFSGFWNFHSKTKWEVRVKVKWVKKEVYQTFKYFQEKGRVRKVLCVCLIGSGKTYHLRRLFSKTIASQSLGANYRNPPLSRQQAMEL